MFLNYGAGLHGHEFSETKSPNHNFRLNYNSLVRSSLISDTPNAPPQKLCEDHRTCWQPIGPLSEQIPRKDQNAVRYQELTHNHDLEWTSEKQKSTFGSENDNLSCNQASNLKKHKSRKSSVFHLAHPAPTLTQTQKFLQIRPKIILQLQLLSKKTRPKPFIDVLPSSVFIPRLARNFPRLFKRKGELGVNDVIVVKSEDYNSTTESCVQNSASDEGSLTKQELIAVICQVPGAKGTHQGVAEIVLSDGSVLTATPLPGGLYEIKLKDENGYEMIAHWWIKTYPERKSVESPDYADVNADLVYAFSVIEPNTRKHPVMATISHKKLEILSSYTSFSTSERHSSTLPFRESPPDSRVASETKNGYIMKEVDERLQRLIQVTGIWVSLRQNWCPYFRYNDALALAISSSDQQSKKRLRTSSLTSETRRPYSGIFGPGSTESFNSRRNSLIGNTIRPTMGRSKSVNRHSCQPVMYPTAEEAVSPGSAFVKRVAARRVYCKSDMHPRVEKEQEEKTKVISRDSVIECQKISPSSQSSAESRSCLPEHLKTTAGVSLKMHRRYQSAYSPPLIPHNDPDQIYDTDKDIAITVHECPFTSSRTGRRKLISNLFRRMNLTSPREQL